MLGGELWTGSLVPVGGAFSSAGWKESHPLGPPDNTNSQLLLSTPTEMDISGWHTSSLSNCSAEEHECRLMECRLTECGARIGSVREHFRWKPLNRPCVFLWPSGLPAGLTCFHFIYWSRHRLPVLLKMNCGSCNNF